MTNKSPEILHTDNENEKFKVSELKEKFDIEVSDEEKNKYGEVLFNLKEIQAVKDGNETITKLGLEKLRTNIDIKSDNIENIKNSISDTATNIGNSEFATKVKEKTGDIKKAVEKGGFVAFVEKMKNSDNPLLKFFGSFLGFFVGLFGFGKKVEDTKEKVKEKLSKEELEKTREKLKTISSDFIDKYNEKVEDKLLPSTKKELEKLIENPNYLSEEELNIILKRIEKGEFKLSDLEGILDKDKYKKLSETIFSEEQIEFLKNSYTNKAMDAIAEEYAIDLKELDKGKKEELRNLIINNGVDQNFIKLGEDFKAGEFISFAELIKTGFLAVPHAIAFTWKLFNIIPFKNLSSHIAKGTTDILQLSYGDDSSIKELMLEKLEGLSKEQKDVVFGIMLRKGMFIFNFLQSLSHSSLRIISESIVGGNRGNSINNIKTFGLNNFEGQAKTFEHLLKTLGKSDINIGEVLKFRVDRLAKATNSTKQIAEIMEIIKDGGDIKTNIGGLKNNQIAQEIIKDGGDIKKILGEKIKSIHSGLSTDSHGLLKTIGENKFGFSKQHELFKLIDSQENSLKAFGKEWNRYLNNGTAGNLRFWEKYNSVKESIRFSQETKNIEIHANTLSEGAIKIDHIKGLFNESPRLASGLFGAAGLSLVINGISNKDETESFLEKMKDIGPYIIPTVGPIKVLFFDQGIQKADTIRDSIKYGTETLAMGLFLGMDIAYIGHELMKSWSGGQDWTKAGKNIAGYHLQIIKGPLYDLPIATKNMLEHMRAVKSAGGTIDYKNIAKGKIDKLGKIISKAPQNKYAIAAALAIGLISISIFTDSTKDELMKKLEEDGFVKKDGNLDLEKIKSNMSDQDKSDFLEYIVWGTIENIDVKVKGDSINIRSKNESVKYKSSLIMSNLDILENIGIDVNDGKKINFEYQKTA